MYMQISTRIMLDISKLSNASIPSQEPTYPKTKNNYKSSTETPNVSLVLIPDPRNTSLVISEDLNSKPSEISKQVESLKDSELREDNGTFVTPEPQFVLKTRRSDGIKYFVNLCVHSSVPKGRIVCSSAVPKESIAKDGSSCHVFDVTVNK